MLKSAAPSNLKDSVNREIVADSIIQNQSRDLNDEIMLSAGEKGGEEDAGGPGILTFFTRIIQTVLPTRSNLQTVSGCITDINRGDVERKNSSIGKQTYSAVSHNKVIPSAAGDDEM